jgi:anti-anti-sigma factor
MGVPRKVFDVEHEGETIIVTPRPVAAKLDYADSKAGVSEVLGVLNDTPAKNVVVDLRRTERCGSAALSLFLRLWKSVRARDGRMILCNVSHYVTELLCATNLDYLYSIGLTREQALAAVKE